MSKKKIELDIEKPDVPWADAVKLYDTMTGFHSTDKNSPPDLRVTFGEVISEILSSKIWSRQNLIDKGRLTGEQINNAAQGTSTDVDVSVRQKLFGLVASDIRECMEHNTKYAQALQEAGVNARTPPKLDFTVLYTQPNENHGTRFEGLTTLLTGEEDGPEGSSQGLELQPEN